MCADGAGQVQRRSSHLATSIVRQIASSNWTSFPGEAMLGLMNVNGKDKPGQPKWTQHDSGKFRLVCIGWKMVHDFYTERCTIYLSKSWIQDIVHVFLEGRFPRLHTFDILFCKSIPPATARMILFPGEAGSGDQILNSFEDRENIRNLKLHVALSDEGARSLATLQSLNKLTLSYCKELTDAGVMALACISTLQTLTIHECSDNMSAEGLRTLSTLQMLNSLTLGNFRLGANEKEGQDAFAGGFPALHTLHMYRCCGISKEILTVLADLPRLETLKLESCSGVDTQTGPLRALITLKTLEIVGCNG